MVEVKTLLTRDNIIKYKTIIFTFDFLKLDNFNCAICRNVISFDLTRTVTFEDNTYKFIFVILLYVVNCNANYSFLFSL